MASEVEIKVKLSVAELLSLLDKKEQAKVLDLKDRLASVVLENGRVGVMALTLLGMDLSDGRL
jgi:hypothetical protein